MATARDLGLRRALTDIEIYSRHVLQVPLRPYQLEPARAILDSVLHRRGLTFTVMMSRQAGKNELSAHLESYLLTLFQRRGGSIVKVAPTFRPQLVNSMLRLESLLSSNELTRENWATSQGYMMAVGRARAFYFSAAPDSSIVGATASLLLEVDEAQDVLEDKYLKDVRPMGAATNVTTVLYGTAWTADTLLERTRHRALALEAADGIRRDFRYPWDNVAEHNPDYGRFVAAEIARQGASHPLIRTQYLLDALEGSGQLLSPAQLAQLAGDHKREQKPETTATYIAAVDIAGEDEEAEDAVLRSLKPRQDSTAVTIARLEWRRDYRAAEPFISVVEQYWWTGRKHRELLPQLVDLLRNVWKVRSVVVDATGIGAGVASFLQGALGERCVPFIFTNPSKSALGYQLLTAVNAGRLKLYADDQSPEASETWSELHNAQSHLRANQMMTWEVPATLGHDDLLISLALAVEAANYAQPRAAVGSAPERK
jgi:hypothetical protein